MALSSSMANLRVSPRRLKSSSVGRRRTRTPARIPALSTDECDWSVLVNTKPVCYNRKTVSIFIIYPTSKPRVDQRLHFRRNPNPLLLNGSVFWLWPSTEPPALPHWPFPYFNRDEWVQVIVYSTHCNYLNDAATSAARTSQEMRRQS